VNKWFDQFPDTTDRFEQKMIPAFDALFLAPSTTDATAVVERRIANSRLAN
jgi:hypothetical protein